MGMIVRVDFMRWMLVRVVWPRYMVMRLFVAGMPVHETVGVRMFVAMHMGCSVVAMGMGMGVLVNMPVLVFIL